MLSCILLAIRFQRDAHLRDATNLKTIGDIKIASGAAAAEAAAAAENMRSEYESHVSDLNAAIGARCMSHVTLLTSHVTRHTSHVIFKHYSFFHCRDGIISKQQHRILQQQQRNEQLERALAAANRECQELNELVNPPPPSPSRGCFIMYQLVTHLL